MIPTWVPLVAAVITAGFGIAGVVFQHSVGRSSGRRRQLEEALATTRSRIIDAVARGDESVVVSELMMLELQAPTRLRFRNSELVVATEAMCQVVLAEWLVSKHSQSQPPRSVRLAAQLRMTTDSLLDRSSSEALMSLVLGRPVGDATIGLSLIQAMTAAGRQARRRYDALVVATSRVRRLGLAYVAWIVALLVASALVEQMERLTASAATLVLAVVGVGGIALIVSGAWTALSLYRAWKQWRPGHGTAEVDLAEFYPALRHAELPDPSPDKLHSV